MSLAVGETHGDDSRFTNPEGVEFGPRLTVFRRGEALGGSDIHTPVTEVIAPISALL
ncbi:MAG: hypothetical protein ACLQVM_00385 [Terriglobia bacterium]